jgi:hypothetical protein
MRRMRQSFSTGRLTGLLPFFIACTLFILCSACNAAPTPVVDGPILTNGQALPKALATIYLSPTPDVLVVSPTATSALPSNTPSPPTVTPTGTPVIGNFLGDQTRAPVDGTFTWQPTHVARVIILTPVPGVHPTAAPVIFNGGFNNGFNGGTFPIGTPGVFQPPIVISLPPAGTPHPCSIPIMSNFANAYARTGAASARLGCPTTSGYGLRLVSEAFQTGIMFWRETKDIYALSTLNLSKGAPQDSFWHTIDTWTDSIPASDPTLKPPSGTTQPVRGFGYAWRSNAAIRNGLGWAVDSEQQYNGYWQDFEHGFMLTGNNNTVYALVPLDSPVTTGIQFGALSP